MNIRQFKSKYPNAFHAYDNQSEPIESFLDSNGIYISCQPYVDLRTNEIVAFCGTIKQVKTRDDVRILVTTDFPPVYQTRNACMLAIVKRALFMLEDFLPNVSVVDEEEMSYA